jgi:hypothetical protein
VATRTVDAARIHSASEARLDGILLISYSCRWRAAKRKSQTPAAGSVLAHQEWRSPGKELSMVPLLERQGILATIHRAHFGVELRGVVSSKHTEL